MYHVQQVDSFSAWRKLISNTFVPLEAKPVRTGPFSGRLSGRQLHDVGIMRLEAGPQTVSRSPELIARGGVGHYKLSLQLSGHALLLQDGREAVLQPGDVAIYDTQRPYTLTFDDSFETLVLMFPQHLLGLPSDDVSDLTAVRMGKGNRLAESVAPFVASIATQLPELRSPIGHRLALNIVDLLSTMLADEIYSQPDQNIDNHGRMLSRIQHHIEANLADPTLGPDAIARTHHIATRTLHKIFSESALTVAGWIRERRMEHCRRDLVDPLYEHVLVGEIGARWGLPDGAHFSRVFRTTYGLSPSQYRRSPAALAG
ncbi:helix-turn-helix domain-containing protein [Arthrobacter roseus]|uniref:AraC-like ligand-binding domain-containing protein n=1 Tax=Arthrobacter roseus TaxID=136274 RepID=UPI001962C268|nr:helix-turn-helix domain-containing protein [Arthrobacter roseus]